MAAVELAPLRPWRADFFPDASRFSQPDLRDLPKWRNRAANNLLYYQTNYITMAALVFLVVGYLNPVGMFLGMAVVSLVFLGSVWAADNRAAVRDFKRQNPSLFIIAVMLASYFLMSLFGGVMVFIFGITFPLLLIFAHASLRLRNMKNKMENRVEGAGLRRSPMGVLLDALDQPGDGLTKIHDFLEGTLKE